MNLASNGESLSHGNTTHQTLTLVNSPPTNSSAEDLNYFFFAVGTSQAAIGVVGVIFNALNIFVLSQLVKRRGVSPTYHLLIAMGVADLLTLLIVTLYRFSLYSRNPPILFYFLSDDHPDFYHILHYVGLFPANVFSLASNWLVVATTVFRFLAVAFPMKVCQWCTLLRMRLSILTIFFLSLAMNVPDMLTVRIFEREDGKLRGADTDLYDQMKVYHAVYVVVETYVPFVLNLVLVIALIHNLRVTSRSMAQSIQNGTVQVREKEHRKIGIMLIAIVLWFLLCNLPYIVYLAMRDAQLDVISETEKDTAFQKFSLLKEFGLILNHACNIIFYCLCNKTYRRIFANTLLCRRKFGDRGYSRKTEVTQLTSRSEYVTKLRELRDTETSANRLLRNNNNVPHSKYSAQDSSGDAAHTSDVDD